MVRDILVHVTGRAAALDRLAYAFDLAAPFGARVTGIAAGRAPEVPPVFRAGDAERVQTELAAKAAGETDAAAAAFRDRARDRGVETRWRSSPAPVVEAVCAAARYADLVVVGHEPTEAAAPRDPLPLAAELVLKCGRPVLVVPPGVAVRAPPRRVAIAWDGSRQAVRAVHDALPLLAAAEVSLAVVADPEHGRLDDDVVSGAELVDHLGRHGVAVEPVRPPRIDASERSVLAGFLAEVRPDLLVMGAFGHPALWEYCVGGTTAELLAASPVPAFIAH